MMIRGITNQNRAMLQGIMRNRTTFILKFHILILPFFIPACASGKKTELAPTPEAQSRSLLSASAPQNLQARIVDRSGVVRSRKIYVAPLEFEPTIVQQMPPEGDIYKSLKLAVEKELQVEAIIDSGYLSGQQNPPLGSKREIWIQNRARALGADSILNTRLNQYESRIGSSVGITRPGKVNFQMILKPLTLDAEYWVASYHYADKQLSDDFLEARSYLEQRKNQSRKSMLLVLEEGLVSALHIFDEQRSAAFSGR